MTWRRTLAAGVGKAALVTQRRDPPVRHELDARMIPEDRKTEFIREPGLDRREQWLAQGRGGKPLGAVQQNFVLGSRYLDPVPFDSIPAVRRSAAERRGDRGHEQRAPM